jgi:hypothetical protein
VPTVLSWLGMEPHPPWQGSSLFSPQGRRTVDVEHISYCFGTPPTYMEGLLALGRLVNFKDDEPDKIDYSRDLNKTFGQKRRICRSRCAWFDVKVEQGSVGREDRKPGSELKPQGDTNHAIHDADDPEGV